MVYENLKEICKEKHITFQEIEVAADLGAGCISRWKDGKVSPNVDTLKKDCWCNGNQSRGSCKGVKG